MPKKSIQKPEKKTPLAKMLSNALMGIEDTAPQNDIPVEYFKVLFSKFYNYFYENGEEVDDEPVAKKITEVFGIKTEFEKNLKYPYSKKDKTGEKFRIIVLPDTGSDIQKQQRAFDMIKEFEGLESTRNISTFLIND